CWAPMRPVSRPAIPPLRPLRQPTPPRRNRRALKSPSRRLPSGALTLTATQKTYVLGAPEMLEPFLRPGSNLGDQAPAWGEKGLRVLLFACYDQAVDLYDANGQPHLQPDLIPLGFVSLGDMLRPEARETLAAFS